MTLIIERPHKVLLLGLVFLLGCSVQPPLEDTRSTENPAVQSLLLEAQYNLELENYELAKAKLERALRIEPNNATLWFELAQVNYRQMAIEEARNLAERAQRLARGNEKLSEEIESFIKHLREF